MAFLSAPPSLFDPEFRRYSFGSALALIGVWAQRTVLAWLSWDLTGAAFWVGVIAFCAFAPTILLAPVFGVWADRANLKTAALTIQVLQLAITVAALCLFLMGWLTLWPLIVVSLAYGVVMSAHHPVRMSLTPLLVQRDHLPNAIAVTSMSFNLARLVGPAACGAVIAGYGVEWALMLTITSLIPQLGILVTMHPHAPLNKARAPVGFVAAITDGVRIAYSRRLVRISLLLTALFAMVVRGMLELLPTIADGLFGRGAVGFGQLMAAAGAGALISAVLIAGRAAPNASHLPRPAIAAIFGGFLATVLIGASPVWALTLVGVAVGGFCGTYVGVTLQSTVQMNIQDGERGRVMSLWSIVAIGAAAIGALILGAVADVTGIGSALIAGGVVGTLGVATLLFSAH